MSLGAPVRTCALALVGLGLAFSFWFFRAPEAAADQPASRIAAPGTRPSPSPPPVAPAAPADLLAEARMLFRAVACGDLAQPVPATLPAKVVDAHCKNMAKVYQRFDKKWVQVAGPYLAKLRPPALPAKVIYPFGGGDLMFALVTFPDATELTSISLERAGDVRSIATMKAADFKLGLADCAYMITRLAGIEYSFTEHMAYMQKSRLPVQTAMALAALAALGYEPLSLRYFSIEQDGGLRYLSVAELDAGAAAQAQSKEPAAIAGVFANVELTFRKTGDAAAPIKTYRTIAANLGDKALRADPRIIKHLERKGAVAAMVKAASYLLWRDDFQVVRDYLLGHMTWMISDSTGILPMHAQKAGFVQEVHGQFQGSLLSTAAERNKDMLALWKGKKVAPLAFNFGYPDNTKLHGHLVVTSKKGTSP